MMRYGFIIAAVLVVAGCGGSGSGSGSAREPAVDGAGQPTVFDPLVQSLERAEGVQQAIDDRAAEQRRRLEEAER